jgi:hypothetical protein
MSNLNVDQLVLVISGVIVVVTVLLGVYVHPGWLWITGLMGLHMVQMAFTGFCPLAKFLGNQGCKRGAAL